MAQQQAPIQPVIGALDEALTTGQQADDENDDTAPLPAAPAPEANVSLDFRHPFYHLFSFTKINVTKKFYQMFCKTMEGKSMTLR